MAPRNLEWVIERRVRDDGRHRRSNRKLTLLVAAVLLGTWARVAGAIEIRLATENDFLNPAKDDLYTFSVAIEADHGPYRFSLRENAFTDRNAGTRFDETYLTLGRALPTWKGWNAFVEAGVVHVGHGLFGQDAQNAVHRLIGDEEVELQYYGSSLHASLGLEAERHFGISRTLDLGPRVELYSAPGFQSHAVLGAQARWQPTAAIAVHLLAGGRLSDTSFAPLDPHVADLGPVGRIGVVWKRLSLSWTYNDYGDEREHLSVGYRIPLGGGEPAVRSASQIRSRR